MKRVKLVRLKSGEDVISYIKTKNEEIRLTEPLNIVIRFNQKSKSQDLILSYWLPKNIVKDNFIDIPLSEVLFITDVKAEFKEYYENFIENINLFEDISENLEERIIEKSKDIKKPNKLH